MKTSVKKLTVYKEDSRSGSTTFTTIDIRDEYGNLKSRYLTSLARQDRIKILPENLFLEIWDANRAREGDYDKLLKALMETTAFKMTAWQVWRDRIRASMTAGVQITFSAADSVSEPSKS